MQETYPLSKLIAPIFLDHAEQSHSARPTGSLLASIRYSSDSIAPGISALRDLGLNSFLVYPLANKVMASTEEQLTRVLDPEYFLYQALRNCRERHPESLLVVDLCTCHFLVSGQCGIELNGTIDNQLTLEFYKEISPLLAAAGAHALCVSSMMDGVVSVVRKALDETCHHETLIISQSAKLHSGFYGPFQNLGGGLNSLALKMSYQVDPGNATQMRREIELDFNEGADMVLLKPISQSLDVLPRIRHRYPIPLLGYTTGGEYLMLQETLPAEPAQRFLAINHYFCQMKAVGLSGIVSYFAQEYAQLRSLLAIK